MDTKALRELAEKATPGPWDTDTDDLGTWINAKSHPQPIAKMGLSTTLPKRANAEFISACDPQSIIALCDRLEEAENEIKYLRGREQFLERFVLDVYDILHDDAANGEEKLAALKRRMDEMKTDGLNEVRNLLQKKGEQ